MGLASEYKKQFGWREWPAIFDALPPLEGQTVLDLGWIALTEIDGLFGHEPLSVRADHTPVAKVYCCIAVLEHPHA